MSDYIFSEYEIEQAFYDFVQSLGYEADYKGWKSDGVRRTARLKSSEDKGRESSAKARLYVDMPANGWIADYRHNEYIEWDYADTLKSDKDKQTAYSAQLPSKEEQEAKRAARKAYEEWERSEAIREARKRYDLTQPFNGTHEYLEKKSVRAHKGVRRDSYGNLCIPMYGLPDMVNIVNYQRIAPDGGKYFAPDCSVQGAVYIIGEPQPEKPLGLAEGYATAATVYEATGIPIAVCFNCHNMIKAAQEVKKHIKAAGYFIFADNDRANAENPRLMKNHGMEAAREAAAALKVDGAHIIAPPADEGCNVDWNDRAAMLDAEELKAELDAKIRYAGMSEIDRRGVDALKQLKPPMIDRIADIAATRGKGFDLEWNFYNTQGATSQLKTQGLTILAARTGGGKTISLSNIAARAIRINPEAHVLFLSLEEAEESVLYRILGAYIAQGALEYGGSVVNAPTLQEIQRAIESRGEGWKNAGYEADRDKWQAIVAAMNSIEQRLLVADLINSPNLRDVDFTTALCSAFFMQHRENAVICIDYLQMLQPSGQSSGDYRDFKRVMSKLKELIAARVNIFAGAQLNREPAKISQDPGAEFYTAYCEHIREAADIEQAAELILYVKADNRPSTFAMYGAPCINFRTLKNRRGATDLKMAMPVNFERGAYHWTEQRTATFLTENEQGQQTEELNSMVGRLSATEKRPRKRHADGRI